MAVEKIVNFPKEKQNSITKLQYLLKTFYKSNAGMGRDEE